MDMLTFEVAMGSALTALLVIVAVRLEVAIRRALPPVDDPIDTLPTVSVCIPARNETHALTECLERVLASDYSKIEIIVFDDNSSDDTSILIRSFAHAGVRFVPGTALPEGWLGKNHALSILAREASGSKLLFLDVDTKLSPTSISRIVRSSVAGGAVMLSVLPLRRNAWRLSVLMTPLRYLWELLLSSRHTPATTSAMWMIDRKVLIDDCQNFTTVASDIRPEQRIAEQLGGEKARFVIATKDDGIYQEKRWHSQIETARRLLYPMVGLSLVPGIAAAALMLALALPLVGVIVGLLAGASVTFMWASALLVGYILLYARYLHRVWADSWWLGAVLWPLLALQEFCLMITSIVGYLTNSVTWKGRLVSAPVLHDDAVVIESSEQ